MSLLDRVNNATDKKVKRKSPEAKIPAVGAIQGGVRDRGSKKNLPYKEVSPSICIPWSRHDRNLDAWLNEEKSGTLKAQIADQGQTALGLIRPLDDDSEYDYEIIHGVRRWWACMQLGIPFRATVTNASDEECYRLMFVENNEHEGVSELETAMSLYKQIKGPDKSKTAECIYESFSAAGSALKRSKPYIKRLYDAGSLSNYGHVVVALTPVISDISIRQSESLALELKDKSDRLSNVNKLCKKISAENKADLTWILAEIKKELSDDKVGAVTSTNVAVLHRNSSNKTLVRAKFAKSGKVTIEIDKEVINQKGSDRKDILQATIDELIKQLDEE